MKKKILISFTLSLIIPIAVMIGLFFTMDNSTLVKKYLISDITLKNKQVKDVEAIESFIDNLCLDITYNYDKIKEYDTFYEKVFNKSQRYVSNLQVIDTKGNLLFDASNKESTNKHIVFNKKTIESFNDDFDKEIQDLNKISEDIYVNNQLAGTALITMKVNINTYFKKYFYLTIAIFCFSFFILIALILFFSIQISSTISKPIKSLKLSAEAIANGTFDIEVNYNKKNEIGKFCETFDSMRLQLKDAFEEKARYENSRKELFACISHDLRTPITSIKSYVEGLEQGVATTKEKQDRYLSVIKNKTDALNKMIDDLFCLSKLEIGQFPMNFMLEDSSYMFTDILSTFEIESKDKHIEFKINHPIPSVKLQCDKRRISQVVSNIIENAKKYIDNNGSIEISTVVENDFFIVSIKDNGTGISSDKIPYVFDHFYTGEKSRTKKEGGTGLGLAICRQIILSHSGDIWIESKVDIGTTIYFSLPI
ncbi:HAMP domain-containing protein [Lutibacter sp. B2]|nr:HAMP domain-containing protein [Lutibacter sp. B2]